MRFAFVPQELGIKPCPNVSFLSRFPCLRQAITGNSGQSLPLQCCASPEAVATLRIDVFRCGAPCTRKEA
jgi:hypothetical protein